MIFPILLALVHIGVNADHKTHYLIYAAVLVFVFISGFSNPAFLVGCFGLVTLHELLSIRMQNYKIKALKLSLFYTLIFLLLSPYLLSYIYNLFSIGLGSLAVIFSPDDTIAWARWTKVSFVNIFRLNFIPMSTYPDNYSYDSAVVRWVSILFSYAVMAALIISVLIGRKGMKKSSINLMIIVIVIIFYASYMRLHDGMLKLFFSLPLSFSLRSPEKLTIFLNSFLFLTLASNLNWVGILQWQKKVLYFLLLAALIEPLPFWLGKFHDNVSINKVWNKQYNTMVKIPDSYREIANYLNNYDTGYYKILSMPYTGQIGIGWSLRKPWKFIGFDTTTQYFNNPVFLPIDGEANFNFAIKLDADPFHFGLNEFVFELQKRGIKYLIVDRNVGDMNNLMRFDSFFKGQEKYFEFVVAFENLTLYKLKDDYFKSPIQTRAIN
mgnify:CR=1 FL=1